MCVSLGEVCLGCREQGVFGGLGVQGACVCVCVWGGGRVRERERTDAGVQGAGCAGEGAWKCT